MTTAAGHGSAGHDKAGQDHHVAVARGNEEQFTAWNGDEGTHWAAHPEFFDAMVRNLHSALMAGRRCRAARPGARHRMRQRPVHP